MQKSLSTIRHSCAHLLAAAVLDLFPKVKFGIGPAIEEGFYYDFRFEKPISEKDLSRIEERMKNLRQKKLEFIKKEVSIEEARKIFQNQPFKLELISDLQEEGKRKVSIYQLGNFTDLCAGPHVKNTLEIGPFKLLSLAGAYWKGDEKNPMLTRIYGTCFPTKKELEEYLSKKEEAKKRDHIKLGKELNLFSISSEVGPGLVLWHPKLSIVRQEIEKFWKEIHKKENYLYVYTPHIGKKQLWVRSGHWEAYREMMYSPMEIEGVEYLLKPMNCPFHVQIYKSQIRSYKDLPIKYCELGTVYRFEKSGVLHGLMRVRGFTQDDSHIFCRPEQLKEEINKVLDLSQKIYSVFRFKDFSYELSVRDLKKKKKYIGREETWQLAERVLKEILEERKVKYHLGIGEAKFYGPAIDLKLKDALGREWQCGTIQVDFNFPERFNLTYIDKEGKKQRVVMVHRTILGTMERFVGILLEHFAGAFPLWLAPTQMIIIPITDREISYGEKVKSILEKEDFRVKIDTRSATTSYKIRSAQLEKIPYMLVVGKREVEEEKIAVRLRSGKDLGPMPLDQFIRRVKEEIEEKR